MSLVSLDPELPPLNPRGKILRSGELSALVEARRILEDARHRAAGILDSAEASLATKKAWGFQLGMEEGMTESAKHHWETVISTARYFRRVEGALADTILECISQIVESIPPRERVLELISVALRGMGNLTKVTIWVHPDNVTLVAREIAHLQEIAGEEASIEISARPELGPEDCTLETPLGLVDASLKSQLSAFRSVFTSTRTGPP